MSIIRENDAKFFTFDFATKINNSADQVWNLLSFGINEWWMQDFRAIPNSTVSLDLRTGGMLLESGTDGQVLEWYRVQMVNPGESVYLVGHLAQDWGGPTISMLKLSLESKGRSCVLTVADSLLGNVTSAKAANVDEGWKQLFGESLKQYAEGSRQK